MLGQQGMVGDELDAVRVCIVDGLPSHRHGWLHTGANDLLEHVDGVCMCVR